MSVVCNRFIVGKWYCGRR